MLVRSGWSDIEHKLRSEASGEFDENRTDHRSWHIEDNMNNRIKDTRRSQKVQFADPLFIQSLRGRILHVTTSPPSL